MRSTLTFHDLPAEIRIAIYKLYFTVDGGYRYSHESTKLTKADGKAIDLSLMLASQLIARETALIPLHVNPLHFSTGSSRFENTYAGYHDVNMHSKADFLSELNDWLWLAETPEMYNRVMQKYPQFAVALDASRSRRRPRLLDRPLSLDGREGDDDDGLNNLPRGSWGEAPSLWREASQFAWETAACIDKDRASEAALNFFCYEVNGTGHDPLRPIRVKHNPWDIPTLKEAESIKDSVKYVRLDHHRRKRSHKYRWSAASLAIRFLKSLTRELRLQVCHIFLHEDQRAVAHQACHALGMVSLCKENPRLHVEQRVSLFGTILQSAGGVLPEGYITEYVAIWLIEALRVIRAMSSQPFTFVLDGEPALDKANIIFEQVIQRDLALHHAMEESIQRQLLRPSDPAVRRRWEGCYVMEGFPEAMQLLKQNNGPFRCNFDPGSSRDVEKMIQERRGMSREAWSREGRDHPVLPFKASDIVAQASPVLWDKGVRAEFWGSWLEYR